MRRRDPRTQIHSGIDLISPYCEEKEPKRDTDHHTHMHFMFSQRLEKYQWLLITRGQSSYERIPITTWHRDLFCADLQCMRPVAGGPVRDAQGGDCVASINLWLRYKPALSWWWRRWWWLSSTWGYLVTHTHILYLKHWHTCSYLYSEYKVISPNNNNLILSTPCIPMRVG